MVDEGEVVVGTAFPLPPPGEADAASEAPETEAEADGTSEKNPEARAASPSLPRLRCISGQPCSGQENVCDLPSSPLL